MANKIVMKTPANTVLSADVVFEIHSDGEKLGELHVSKGSIDWYHRNARIASSLRWKRFDQLMELERSRKRRAARRRN